MASFREEYSYRQVDYPVRHDVCNIDSKTLTEDREEYEKHLYNLLLDELLKSPDAFTA